MRSPLITVVAGALVLAFGPRAAQSQSAEGLSELKAQLAALQERVAQLEKQQHAQQEAQDRTTDVLAQTKSSVGDWVGRFQWKGDLRYRNETIDQEFAARERNRDRIRLRAGFFARVNDTLRAEVMVATTENGDARSSNQTLTNVNSRKALDLDMAYAEWRPNAQWKATFGKIRYPWHTTPSFFFDKDVNPEGIGISWQQGATGLFANAFYTHLAERSAQADSNMAGAQIGWRGDLSGATRLTLAAGYFDHNAVQGYNTVQDGNVAGSSFSAFGNSTTNVCRRGITACIANDFNIVEVSAELATTLGGRPLALFADYAMNDEADFGATPGLDTAWAAGFMWGRVSGARTWEIGYIHQVTEKDALFGQWIDSDFAAGQTDGEGGAIRLGYGFARNFRVNATWFLTNTNVDVPTTIADVGAVTERDYRRLQLDLNMSF